MDPVTHGITGALLGKAFFSEDPAVDSGQASSPTRVAIVAGTLGALFPDIDSLYGVFDPSGLAVISTHRAETHSFVGLPFFALALAAGTLAYCRWRGIAAPSFLRLAAVWGVGLASHIVLDLITSFGTMIFAPLSYARYQWDLVFIIDAALTSIVLVPQLAARVFLRREGNLRRAGLSWIILTLAVAGLRKWALANQVDFSVWALVAAGAIFAVVFFAPAVTGIGFHISRRAWCRTGAMLLVAYLGACALANRAALSKVNLFVEEKGIAAEQLAAQPMPPWMLRWSGLIRTKDGVYQANFSLAGQPPQFTFYGDALPNGFIAVARQLPAVKTFFAFARFPRTHYSELGGRHIVEFSDLRFAGRRSDRATPFTYRVVMDSGGLVLNQGWRIEFEEGLRR